MKNSTVDALNKVSLPTESIFGSEPEILWMNAACNENKFSLNLKPHNHAFFEMHIVTSGSIVYRFKGGDAIVEENSIILISPYTIHCIPTHSENFQKITVAFEAGNDGELRDILKSKNECIIQINDQLQESLSFILHKAKNRTACSETMIKNRLCEIIYAIAESTGIRPSLHNDEYDMRLVRAKKFIEDNHHIFLTCDEVARYCNLSTKQLGRLFLKYENTSLMSFIHGQKIEDAKRMVLDTDELFDDISEKLGFSSVNYFGKFFAKHTGVTPGEFRRGTEKKHKDAGSNAKI